VSYCSTVSVLFWGYIYESKVANYWIPHLLYVLVLFWGYIYESEATDSWIPHLTNVLLNRPMVKVDALSHSYGGMTRQAFHFHLYDSENYMCFNFIFCCPVFTRTMLAKIHLQSKVYLLLTIRSPRCLPHFTRHATIDNKISKVSSTSLTVWRKCLIFCCSAFTVFSSNGSLEFRVDIYP
jgi:hypothetical protein